ncbi:unnamed protein product [Rotaria magnacalcarata]|uniref:Uncharacterized protein n=1 Tax=Rotaria magnacalcarata TaxID=392030 RepID=A0A8S2LA24_9BILA|nr:unnamed protein product [Rotaria magnacalcarata]CAF4371123.1 unnamed protein product [Rotaria magnacalcarata]
MQSLKPDSIIIQDILRYRPTAYERIVMVSSMVKLTIDQLFYFYLDPTTYEQIVMVNPTAFEEIVLLSSIVQLKGRSFFYFYLDPTAFEEIVMIQQHMNK